MPSLVEQLLARRDRDGLLACSCGLTHRIAAADVLVERGALARAAELFARRHRTAWVLSDENTEAAAGAWKGMVSGAAIRSRVLPGRPRPLPSLELAEELAAEVRGAQTDVLVAIGSGVVSDLVKKVSLEVGLPSWCIATAPSVDAYTSATASLRAHGHHQTMAARSSEVIVCDLDVIARAPRPMILGGIGDLLAKFVASLDWRMASLVTGEHHCAAVADIALEAARAAARAAQALAAEPAPDPVQAAAWLTDAVLVSGLAMQAMGGSRPAASAEHSIAHFWESTGAARREGVNLHGIMVGAATALILPGYLDFFGSLPDPGAGAARADADEDEPLEPGMQELAGMVVARGWAHDPGARAARRKAFARERERIAALAGPLLAELAQAMDALARLGAPLSPEALDIPERLRLLPVRNVHLLRDRYTTFDLARDLGCSDRLMGPIEAAIL
ncbi:MAG TPA: iron-containing alcohol dehydrogenase [Kofleriaceae bacterium]|nr:iron-containing alcohol dehydrogenase [Kofleriaceae bacterium]